MFTVYKGTNVFKLLYWLYQNFASIHQNGTKIRKNKLPPTHHTRAHKKGLAIIHRSYRKMDRTSKQYMIL